jgi:hypothetical protein
MDAGVGDELDELGDREAPVKVGTAGAELIGSAKEFHWVFTRASMFGP